MIIVPTKNRPNFFSRGGKHKKLTTGAFFCAINPKKTGATKRFYRVMTNIF
jgi:hypothetical protein